MVPEMKDSTELLICPETGQLMQRFKVGRGFEFYVDRSPTGSVWLDSGEWEALRGRQFHDELHLIFTAPWQDAVKTEELAASREAALRERLGDDLFSKIEEVGQLIAGHENEQLAMAYLCEKVR